MPARRVVIFGNSGSGKSTLARQIAADERLAHLDLDTIAWEPGDPPQRRSLEQSARELDDFIGGNTGWVIEGCYADLIELVLEASSEIIFLDLSVDDCIANARARPWEPHKYASKAAQDANLAMLIDWISQYPERDGVFSRGAHAELFRNYHGKKTAFTDNRREGSKR